MDIQEIERTLQQSLVLGWEEFLQSEEIIEWVKRNL